MSLQKGGYYTWVTAEEYKLLQENDALLGTEGSTTLGGGYWAVVVDYDSDYMNDEIDGYQGELRGGYYYWSGKKDITWAQ